MKPPMAPMNMAAPAEALGTLADTPVAQRSLQQPSCVGFKAYPVPTTRNNMRACISPSQKDLRTFGKYWS